MRKVPKIMLLPKLKLATAALLGLGLTGWAASAVPLSSRGAGPQKAKVDRGTKPADKAAALVRSAQTTAAITVVGRATDVEGKPVSGATISLVSIRGALALLGTATTDRDGSYSFHEARLPVSRNREDAPPWGTFQVYGVAPGHGFAWHGMRFYQPRPRPAGWWVPGQDYTLFQGKALVMDLRFPASATLSGRVVDQARRPVPDAKVRLGACDYLDTQGKESHPNFREFFTIQSAPAAMTTAKTDKDGRFRLEGLPTEAGFWIWVEHSEHAWQSFYAATTTRPATAFEYPRQSIAGQERPPVRTGPIFVVLDAIRRVAIRTVFADTGRPAARVRVSAGRGSAGPSASGTSDGAGKLLLRLPPGDYEIVADPTPGGADCVRTLSTVQVAAEPAEQPLVVRVKPGCVLFLEVIDAKTGKGIPGVSFQWERGTVQSRTGDDPRSDAEGRLRVVVEPGEGTFWLGYVPKSSGYRWSSQEKRVVLPAGRTVTVRFELEK
jgi:hypothetical protein